MGEITAEDVKKRADVAGLTLRADRIEMVRKLLGDALVPLRALDSRTIKTRRARRDVRRRRRPR